MALSGDDLLKIKELIVEPVVEKLDAVKQSIDASNAAQDAKIAEHEGRIHGLEQNQRKALWGLGVVVVGIQLAWNMAGDWLRRKLGW